jgi:hypothetical protein
MIPQRQVHFAGRPLFHLFDASMKEHVNNTAHYSFEKEFGKRGVDSSLAALFVLQLWPEIESKHRISSFSLSVHINTQHRPPTRVQRIENNNNGKETKQQQQEGGTSFSHQI